MLLRRALLIVAAGVATLAAPLPAAAASPAVSAAAIGRCAASMSVPQPRQNTTTVVRVSGVGAGAQVTTIAHYKTTNTVKKAFASTKGAAALSYMISRATRNYRVVVTVSAAKGAAKWSCSTSFTPR